jgi:type IV pilus assembly protein PilF
MRITTIAALGILATLGGGCASRPTTNSGGAPAAASGSSAMVEQNSTTKMQQAASINLQLGVAYMQTGNLQVAEQKLLKAQDENPHDPQIHSALALLYVRIGNDAKANAEYKESLRLAPGDPDVLNSYGVYLCGKGRTDEGVKYFTQAAQNPLYRTPWAAYTNAGLCMHDAKRIPESEQFFLRAVSFKPNFEPAVVQLGMVEIEQQHPADAARLVREYLAIGAASADVLMVGWRAAQLQGDQEASARYAKRLQSDYPTTDQAHAVADASSGQK